jgi:hypothetical protein
MGANAFPSGHSTNVHMLCDHCEEHICDNCHGIRDKHFCSDECLQEACEHTSVSYERIDDVHCMSRFHAPGNGKIGRPMGSLAGWG